MLAGTFQGHISSPRIGAKSPKSAVKGEGDACIEGEGESDPLPSAPLPAPAAGDARVRKHDPLPPFLPPLPSPPPSLSQGKAVRTRSLKACACVTPPRRRRRSSSSSR